MNVKLKVLTAGALFFLGHYVEAQDTLRVQEIEEVVVVAYGTQRKETLTGSVGQVKAAELAKVTSPNVVQGMTGKIAGVQIAQVSGQPGEAPTVRFRGIGSISGSSAPLYVVDGVPMSGSITQLNNNDIESISFLKDASLAALYGNRGANGVIIVTTKKGRRARTSFNLDVKTGINQNGNTRYKTITDPSRYYEAYFTGLANNYMYSQNLSYADARMLAANELISGPVGLAVNIFDVADNALVDPLTGAFNSAAKMRYQPENWEDYLFREGFFTSTFLNASGGNENTTYYFSGGYERNEGYAIASKMDRVTAKAKVDSKLGERIDLGVNFGYTNSVIDNPDGNGSTTYSSPYNWINTVGPIYGVYQRDNNGNLIRDERGEWVYDDGTGYGGLYPIRPYGQFQNPYATATMDNKRTNRNAVFASGYFGFKILKDLNFKYTLTADYTNSDSNSYDTPFYGDAVNANGRVGNSVSSILGITHQQLLNYQKSFNSHRFDVLAGHETYDNRYSYLSVSKSNLFYPYSQDINSAALYTNPTGGKGTYATEGYFGRVNYDYGNKYFVSANIRRDGSSRFHPDNRWGTFYGFGGAWRVSQESFLSDSKVINELKLKGSYGEQGNDNLGLENDNIYYPYMNAYVITPQQSFNEVIGYDQVYLGNKNITWEKMKNLNAGVELSLLDRRINIDAEYFERNVSDMLMRLALSPSGGFSYSPENVGSMENKGVEVTVDVDIIRKDDFRLNIFGNASHYKNKVTSLKEGKDIVTLADNRKLKMGYDAYVYYMKEFAGIDEQGNSLFYKDEKDANGNIIKTVTDDWREGTDYFLDKSRLPEVYGGFGLRADYKNIDFSIDFAYQFGGWGYDGNWMARMGGGRGESIHQDYYNTWSLQNTDAVLPLFSVEDPKFNYAQSTLGLIKSDYLSIQNITLGYSLNRDLLERTGISNLRLYVSANNPIYWSKRQGYDPRLSLLGSYGGTTYNVNRTLLFGTTISF